MKRFLLTSIAIVAISCYAHAQQKGELYLGSNVGIDCAVSAVALSDGYDTVSETSIQANVGLNFTIGYFLSDKWRIAAYYEANAALNGTATVTTSETSTGTPIMMSYDSVCLGLAYYKKLAEGL